MARLNITIVMLLLIVGIPYYWFMIDNSAPAAKPHPLAIEQLRSLSVSPGDALPNRIRYERIASQWMMGNRIAAGSGLRSIRLHTFSYMADYGDAPPVMIGSGMTKAAAQHYGYESYAVKAQERVMRATAKAREVVPLATLPEQLGGLRSIASTDQGRTLDARLARQQEADRLGAPHRVAPGIVVIPTPQVQAGSRMVYARLGNGREYLFTGTIAPIRANWARLRLPARLVTDLGRREDRAAMLSWLQTINSLKQQAPGLFIVPGNRLPSKSGMQHFFDESATIHS
jgi:hypothetical protein